MMYNIPSSGTKKQVYTNIFQQLELYTFCSRDKQSIESVQNEKKFT